MKARLILSDGILFEGLSLGAPGTTIGEVVFNTAMTGYQEILTDPSYHFQLVVMTYPQIGNYGVNPKDFESRRIYAAGFIIREYSPIVSHWQANKSLDDYLKNYGVVGISEVDTRALTRHLRDQGAQMGLITTSEEPLEILVARLRGSPRLVGRDIASEVTTATYYQWPLEEELSPKQEPSFKVAVYDFGVKYSILRALYLHGCELRVFPARTPPETVLEWDPDGIFLSNGPGDPEPLTYAVDTVRYLLGKKPIFGICLGHQILGLALGGKTTKLKFGHHGANHPVICLPTGAVEITSQNHGFIVAADSLPHAHVEITHINLNDETLEGFRHKSLPAFSVQYHPESAPGPHDSRYLFEQFLNDMKVFHA
ncbi:MAG: glutamine-hydrolyzing carbamoyl-phosphate synthase small subunit [Deltaproteobacteria bacterium]|jgi:carbamoyl-phosphate synthase small subunit|nr:glutamine-hydrolyzing carbamoyl-phosphate synthase small subunit [Deltaproteobacteria bacterium]